jgi:hypothetical protein
MLIIQQHEIFKIIRNPERYYANDEHFWYLF